MKRSMHILTLGLIAVCLTACGGGNSGGDSDINNNSTPQTSTTLNRWLMNDYTYHNGGYSGQTDATTGVKIAIFSTATLDGGDKSNGSYSGSSLSFSFKGNPSDGFYKVIPRGNLTKSDESTPVVVVDVTVGIAVTTGATAYSASSGKILITTDSSGKYHFSTPAPIDTIKALDVLGGVAGAPATMKLTITDLY